MWWHEAVVLQIYPRSFADASGDGVGDLEGVRAQLDHLQWLGVDALWLSPIYRSPMADFGYDVADYCDIDPLFGDLAAFDAPARRRPRARHPRAARLGAQPHLRPAPVVRRRALVARLAQARLVPLARRATDVTPPNNWQAAFADEPAWTWDDATEQWYLHTFLPQQPDLNWDNPEVVAAMHDTLRFWLDRGVDGFRADVVHLIGKDPALPDDPPAAAHLDRAIHDHPGTHALLRGIRGVLDEYPGDRMMVGEVNLTEDRADRAVPRRRRRAAPGVRLRVAARAVGGRARGATRIAHVEDGHGRALADVGVLQPRPAARAHAPGRRRGPSPGRRACCC